MNLYLVQYDGESYYVQAKRLGGAVELWKLHLKRIWREELAAKGFDLPDEPESIALVHEEAVIRLEDFA